MIIIIDNKSHELIGTFGSIELAMDSAAGAPERLVYNLDYSISEKVKRSVRILIRAKNAGPKIYDYLESRGIKAKPMVKVYVEEARGLVDEFEELALVAEGMHASASLCFDKS